LKEGDMQTRFARALCSLVIALAASAAALAGTREDIQADMRAGRWAQADARLEQVLAKHPDNALAHYWRAQVKLREGQLDAAREDLGEAKRLDPEHKFAGDKAVLAKLERALAPAAPVVRSTDPVPAPMPVQHAQPVPMPEQQASSSHIGLWIVLALAALAALMIWATRSARKRGLDAEREQVRAQLEEASNDLRDASKAIDFRAELSPEQRLALSDRVLRAQGDVASHLATLATRSDLSQSHELLRRVRDIAAEVRGEERPSDIEARRVQAANIPGSVMQQPMGMPGSGLGTAGAAVGGLAAGVVIGSLLSGSEHAHARTVEPDAGPRYTPIDDFDGGGNGVDVGGSGDGGGWDSGGSSDTGGGGGGDFD
jgi:Tetratricopeptide repeat